MWDIFSISVSLLAGFILARAIPQHPSRAKIEDAFFRGLQKGHADTQRRLDRVHKEMEVGRWN